MLGQRRAPVEAVSVILVDPISHRSTTALGPSEWCSMASDSSLSELHAFAEKIGMKRAWFQGDHYELTEKMRTRAIDLGAACVTSRQLADRMIARRRSRR